MSSMSAQPACLRCRSRKTKCLGRTENTDCQSCIIANVNCEVVPHQRGRKVGTKLSDSVRERLKRKRVKVSEDGEEKLGESSKRPSGSRSRGETSKYDDNQNQPHQPSNDNRFNAQHTNEDSIPFTYSSNSISQIPPTSSMRSQPQQAQFQLQENEFGGTQGYSKTRPHTYTYTNTNTNSSPHTDTDIGPSIRRTSSIARIFSEKRNDDKEKYIKNSGLSLWREDPITCGYIDERTARELFELFMNKIAPNIYIFDQELHTYEYVQRTCSFLFCVILAIAAKFSPKINDFIHKKCLALAKDQILRVFADDVKSEQTVQALFVLTEYKEAEDENAFLLLGMACRMAVDLDLSSTRPDYDERHNRDRQRIWLALYAADKRFNYCGQTAKPSMMPEDNLIRSSENFVYSPICIAVDYRLASNVALRRVLAVSIEAIDKDNENGPGNYTLDLRSVYQTFERDSDAWVKVQTQRDPGITIHANLTALHAKVIIAHRWVQRSFRTSNPANDATIEENQERERREALAACINGSLGILATMCSLQDDLLRYTCDSKHLYFAYASFFLYKVFDTKIAATILDPQSLAYIFNLFQKSADKLESLALSPTHTIAFHAAFLRRLSKFENESPAIVSQNNQNTTNEVPEANNVVQPTEALDQGALPDHSSSQPQVDPTLSFFSEPLPDLGNWLVGTSADESLGANIDWNDWWPFDDSSWNFGNTDPSNLNGADDSDWQGVIQTL